MQAFLLNFKIIIIRKFIIFSIPFIVSYFVPCFAQDTTGQLQSVALTDIAKRSEETLNLIFQMKKSLEDNTEIMQINEKYDDFLKNLKQSEKDFQTEKKDKSSLTHIAEQERIWFTFKAIISDWLPVVRQRSKTLDDNIKILQNDEKLWNLTKKQARKKNAPAAITERIRSVLKSIKETKAALRSSLNESLTLQSKLTEADIKISEVLSHINRQKEKAGATLLTLDKPVIWKAFKKQEVSSLFIETIKEGMRNRFVVVHHYVENFYQRFVAQFVFFIVLSLIFLTLKRWHLTQIEEDETHPVYKVLDWPVAASFLFSLWLTPSFHPGAPFFINEISNFLMLFPLLHIIPRLLSGFYRNILYFFIFSSFLDQFGALTISGSLLQRLLSLALAVVAILLLASLMRYRKISGQVSDKFLSFLLRWASRLGFLLLGLSIVANIIGAFSLAQFLVQGVLYSGFIATVLLVGVFAINQLWDIILRLEIIQSYRSFTLNKELIHSRFEKIVYWITLYWWIVQTLDVFNLYKSVKSFVSAVIGFQLEVGSLSVSLGDVLIFLITIYISVILSRFIRFILEEDVLRKVKLPRGVAGSISMLTHYVILAIGFTVAMSAAGIEWSRFAILAGALGVGIGFGLQDVVNNFVSGLILIFERPIKLGDVIELENLRGNVKRIGIRSSTIRTFEGAEVIVPNSFLISNKVVNWTLSDRMRRVSVPVGVAYGTDPKTVIKLLENIAKKHQEVREKPEPVALFLGFGESSLDFELRFWTNNFDTWLELQTDISVHINEELAKAGIEIPFPQRDIHIIAPPEGDKSAATAQKKKTAKAKQKK